MCVYISNFVKYKFSYFLENACKGFTCLLYLQYILVFVIY